MDAETFRSVVNSIIRLAEGNHELLAGLPPIDVGNEQLCFTRTLEILDKGISLDSIVNDQEANSFEFLDSFGMHRKILRDELMKAKANINFSGLKP
jgi:hypothetical protein